MSTECKYCIKNKFWNKFLPLRLLTVCKDCNELGIKYKKMYKYGTYFTILGYSLIALILFDLR